MIPRALITTIGATALAFGVVVGGSAVAPPVGAQETATATATADQETEVDPSAEAYDAFVAALAQQFDADPAEVDAGIREALKAQVDEREANGEIGTEGAAALKAVIDVSDAPLMLGGPGWDGGERGFRGRHGDMKGRGRGGDDPGWFVGDDRPGDDRAATEAGVGADDEPEDALPTNPATDDGDDA